MFENKKALNWINLEESTKYQNFVNCLNKYQEDGMVLKLHRGFNKEFAFKRLKLDVEHNSINQFAERLFFFGEKSKHLWEERYGEEIGINDLSDKAFKIIFDFINKLDLEKYPVKFIKENQGTFEFFKNTANKEKFLNALSKLNTEQRKELRRQYLTVLHQLDKNEYKGQSLYISGSENINVSKKFAGSRDAIVINFWDFLIEKRSLDDCKMPIFNGAPYSEEQEISVFGAVFPHYIYSFVYNGKIYPNPAIETETDFDISVFSGFTIQQFDFKTRVRTMTNYKRMIEKNGDIYYVK